MLTLATWKCKISQSATHDQSNSKRKVLSRAKSIPRSLHRNRDDVRDPNIAKVNLSNFGKDIGVAMTTCRKKRKPIKKTSSRHARKTSDLLR